MKRMLCFSWFMAALFAVFLSVADWQEAEAMPEQMQPECHESSVMSPRHHHHHEATLSDATGLYRICSSRPQRLLPTQGSRSVRTLTPSFGVARQYIVRPLHSYFDSRCRLESAPFCLSASCDYFVIALRHIIR